MSLVDLAPLWVASCFSALATHLTSSRAEPAGKPAVITVAVQAAAAVALSSAVEQALCNLPQAEAGHLGSRPPEIPESVMAAIRAAWRATEAEEGAAFPRVQSGFITGSRRRADLFPTAASGFVGLGGVGAIRRLRRRRRRRL